MGAAAAETDDHVAVVFPVHLQARANIQISGVGFGSAEDYRLNAGILQQLFHLVGHAQLHHALVGDEQRLAAAEKVCRCAKLLDGADTHFGNRWNEEIKNLFC